MLPRTMQLILFGPPGIGKGTQSALLVERLGLKHVSTGDLLRGAIRGGTALGQQAKAFIDAGRLVPGALVRGIANERLAEIGYDNVILDGYPRTVEQAEWVDEDFAAAGHPITVVVSITGDNEVIVERLAARGRPDDAPDIVRKRLAVYAAETAPVEDHYRQAGLLVTVDGEGDVEEVYGRIVQAIESVLVER
ncbi:MAG: adenylate kinase [Bacteroidetes bacterium]|nr:adenylate kinase [Bacteroidota bacterium]